MLRCTCMLLVSARHFVFLFRIVLTTLGCTLQSSHHQVFLLVLTLLIDLSLARFRNVPARFSFEEWWNVFSNAIVECSLWGWCEWIRRHSKMTIVSVDYGTWLVWHCLLRCPAPAHYVKILGAATLLAVQPSLVFVRLQDVLSNKFARFEASVAGTKQMPNSCWWLWVSPFRTFGE